MVDLEGWRHDGGGEIVRGGGALWGCHIDAAGRRHAVAAHPRRLVDAGTAALGGAWASRTAWVALSIRKKVRAIWALRWRRAGLLGAHAAARRRVFWDDCGHGVG